MPSPIEPAYNDKMNALATVIDDFLNPSGEREVVFALVVARAGDIKDGRVNYISSGERDDMQKMLKELLQRQTGESVNVVGSLMPTRETVLPGLPRGKTKT